MQVQQFRSSQPTFAQRSLPKQQVQVASQDDLVTIGQNQRPMGDYDAVGKLLGGLFIGGIGLAAGLAVGGIGGSMLGAHYGHPVMGVALGMVGCGLVGGAIGASIGSR